MAKDSFQNVAVLGGGSWGTALAYLAAQACPNVRLWARDAAQVQQIRTQAETPSTSLA